jgi:lipopolysaccharide transport system ATP-binding protein
MIAIRAENISKSYRLGTTGAGRLREDIRYWLRKQTAEDHLIWALKNVSFDINQGEVMGFIGNNGAGKSHPAEDHFQNSSPHFRKGIGHRTGIEFA